MNKLFKSSFLMQIETNKQLILPGDIDTSPLLFVFSHFKIFLQAQKKKGNTHTNTHTTTFGKGQFRRVKIKKGKKITITK